MRRPAAGLLLAVCLILHSSVAELLEIRGVAPDLFLILTLLMGLVHGAAEGAVFGLALGTLQDFVYSRSLGMSAFVKMSTGFAAGVAGRRLFRENILVLVVTVFAGTLVSGGLFFVMARIFGSGIEFLPALGGIVVPGAVYNSVLAPFLYWALRRLEFVLAARGRARLKVDEE